MRPLATLLLLAFIGNGPIEDALKAYQQGNYGAAILAYRKALAESPIHADEVRFNIAQCYAAMDSVERASELYRELIPRLHTKERALASNQMGIYADNAGKTDQALALFRQALVADPSCGAARYNYELIRKRIQHNPPPPPPPPPPHTPPPPPSPTPKPHENSNQNNTGSQMSEEEAKNALAQLKAREKQFLQEQRKRSKIRQHYQDGPDW